METSSIIKDLMSKPGVTGFEEQRRIHIIEYFSKFCDSVSVDVIGNVIGTIGAGEKSVMLAGHYDQIGFMIKHIDEKGYAYFSPVGGWDPRVIYGARVKIWTGNEPTSYILGTIGAKPVHLVEKPDLEKAVKITDMHIDFGAKNKKEAIEWGVHLGCVVTLDSPVTCLGKAEGKRNSLVVGAGLDDTCAVVSFIKALEILTYEPPKKIKIHVVATVQEEIGCRGAQISGFNIAPWCAIASDVTHAIAPRVKASQVGEIEIGKGPAIGVGANFTKKLWTIMEQKAKANGIPYQVEPVPTGSGTDAWYLQVLRGGTISGLISIPCRYMHSPNEVISLEDVENTGKLIATTIKALEEQDIKHVTEIFRKK